MRQGRVKRDIMRKRYLMVERMEAQGFAVALL
jgi:hypothetical protein